MSRPDENDLRTWVARYEDCIAEAEAIEAQADQPHQQTHGPPKPQTVARRLREAKQWRKRGERALRAVLEFAPGYRAD